MAKAQFQEKPASQDNQFTQKTMQWIRPHNATEAYHGFMKGRGTQVWQMFVASAEGDTERVTAALKDDSGLANCENAYFTPLDLAVREGHIAIVKTLLEAGANPTFRRGLSWKTDPLTKAKERGLTEIAALLEAAQRERFNASAVGEEICATVRNGETRKLQALIAQNPASVNAADRDGNTPLHWAVQERRLRPIELLLANGADIHVENSDGRKPIHLAMGASHLQTPRRIVQKLLEHGADYDACVAAVLGDFDRVRELVMVDPTLANQANSANFRPVGYAARMGHAKIVKFLLEHGADPNAPEYDAPNGLALWVAVDGKHLDCVKILLEYGADPTAIVESSGSPIGRAISLKQTEMASLMYAHGATAGLAAYVFQNRIDVVGEILKANPALVNEGGDYGVLCMAAGFASVELIKLLLRYKPDLNRAWYSNNYMGYASRKDCGWDGPRLDVLRLFLEHGADPNRANWFGVTYLHVQAKDGGESVAELLLEFGANIDAIDDEYCTTPLGWAARWEQKQMVEFLLAHGADPNLAREAWAKPLVWAEAKSNTEIAKILRTHGATKS